MDVQRLGMAKGMVFWLVYIVCLLFGGFCVFHGGGSVTYWSAGLPGVEMLLIGLLGWGIYGPAVK